MTTKSKKNKARAKKKARILDALSERRSVTGRAAQSGMFAVTTCAAVNAGPVGPGIVELLAQLDRETSE